MFPGLAGIDAAREITAREKTLAERLAEIGEGTIKEYQGKIKSDDVSTHREIYNALASELTLPEYNADTLQQLVLAYANQKEPEEAAIVRGLYIGVLASELTERNARKGKRTKISLNGGGNDFPYLLYFAHTLDEVVVESFNGDRILSSAGSYGGSVRNVTLTNIKGNGAGAWIAGNGHAGTVTLAGIKGDRAGAYIAWNGRAETVTLAGIKGDYAGEGFAGYGGRVKQLFAGDYERKGNFVGYKGKIIPLQKHKNASRIEKLLQQLKEESEPERLAEISKELAKVLKGVRA